MCIDVFMTYLLICPPTHPSVPYFSLTAFPPQPMFERPSTLEQDLGLIPEVSPYLLHDLGVLLNLTVSVTGVHSAGYFTGCGEE